MKYLYIALIFASCTSKVDTLKQQYYEKSATLDSVKKEHSRINSHLIETGYADSTLTRLSYRLEARIDRLTDSVKKLKEQIDIEK